MHMVMMMMVVGAVVVVVVVGAGVGFMSGAGSSFLGPMGGVVRFGRA